jgi:hypothetical protein
MPEFPVLPIQIGLQDWEFLNNTRFAFVKDFESG